jgi:hypothetical protein
MAQQHDAHLPAAAWRSSMTRICLPPHGAAA